MCVDAIMHLLAYRNIQMLQGPLWVGHKRPGEQTLHGKDSGNV